MQPSLFDLTGRVAVVTGAARGLGRVLAEGLATHGARVVACDINADGARETAGAIRETGGQATWTPVDAGDRGSCDALVRHATSEFGRVDVLVNNAAVDVIEPIGGISEAGWTHVLGVDLPGVLSASQAATRQMLAQGDGGSIINISSIASTIGIPGLGSYSAAKGGVDGPPDSGAYSDGSVRPTTGVGRPGRVSCLQRCVVRDRHGAVRGRRVYGRVRRGDVSQSLALRTIAKYRSVATSTAPPDNI